MLLNLGRRGYGAGVVVICTALTLIATADDEDSAWMAIAAAIAAGILYAIPDGLESAHRLREHPQWVRLLGLLVVLALASGALSQPPESFLGEAAVVVLAYWLVEAARLSRGTRGG
jgi:hypothetical protein